MLGGSRKPNKAIRPNSRANHVWFPGMGLYVPNVYQNNMKSGQVRRVFFFGGGAIFNLAAPSSLPLVGFTQIVLLRFHLGRGGTTVLKMKGTISRAERTEKIPTPPLHNWGTRNVTLRSFYYCNYYV